MRLGHLNLWKIKQQRDHIMPLTSTYTSDMENSEIAGLSARISSTKSGIDGTT
jgi:hypothetical protein